MMKLAFLMVVTAVFGFAPSPVVVSRRPSLVTVEMANNPGALKRIKTNERNRLANREWKAKVRTWTRKTKDAIAAENVEEAKECARVATSMIDRATRRNIYHKNWAARNKSRLSKQVIALILKSRGESPTPAAKE